MQPLIPVSEGPPKPLRNRLGIGNSETSETARNHAETAAAGPSETTETASL